MRHDPSGADLIEAARKALTDEVLPGLTGRPRYVALMVANALGIAAREMVDAHTLAASGVDLIGADDPAGLVQAIREGRRDAAPDLHAALTVHADIASRIWKTRKA